MRQRVEAAALEATEQRGPTQVWRARRRVPRALRLDREGEDRDGSPSIVAKRPLERAYDGTSSAAGICMTGRTSMEPTRADGILAAHSSASSIESASIR